MKKFILIKAGLLVLVSIACAMVSPPATFGQAGKVDAPPSPPKPMPPPKKLDLGKIVGLTYSNEQFGFSFTAPATWTVQNENDLLAMREYSRKAFEDEKDPKRKAAIEASIERTTTLFSASKFAIGASVGFNALLICAAERIPSAIVTTPREYFNLMVKTINNSDSFKVEVVGPYEVKKIGVTEFGTITVKVTFNVGSIIQKHLMAVKAPYVYGLILSYTDNEDAGTFNEVVNSVKSK